MIRGKIQIHAQAVLRLYDSFTQSPVNMSHVRLVLPEGGEALAKTEGCFVLLHCPAGPFDIRIQSPVYEETVLEMNLSDKDPLVIRTCFLDRNQVMPMPEGTTYIEGTGKPNGRITLFMKDKQTALRLLEDYKPGGEKKIRIYHPPEQMLEGCRLYIQGKDAAGELFTVGRKTGEGEYLLEQELSGTYKKVGSSIYPVREGHCGPDGRYSIPFRDVPREGGTCVFLLENGKQRETAVTFGERNKV